MSLISLRFTPPDQTYDGFKFRMASILCLVSGFFSLLFIAKHIIVFDGIDEARISPDSLRIAWGYLFGYYWKTFNGAAEFVLVLAGFAAVFWLNIPKQYFADRYRDYGKEKSSPEAQSLTLLLTLTALTLVLLSIPFLTLHFPVWLSFLAKYGPIVAGILQYLAILPDLKNVERQAAIDKLGWDERCFDDAYRSRLAGQLQNELNTCRSLMPAASPASASRFLTQGSVTVTWSGVDVLFNNLETLLGVSAESMALHNDATQAIEFALGELLDARGATPAVILTTEAEHASVLDLIGHRLQQVYPFHLHTVPIHEALWKGASQSEINAVILKACIDAKPDIAVLSHVFPDTGIVLDIKGLVDAVRKEGLQTLFVIDGSQAVGNIAVSDDVWARTAYYAFHGHGWLLGSPSVGVLVRNGWLLSMTGQGARWISGTRRFSRSSPAEHEEMPATYDAFIPWFALNYVLKHEWLAVGAEAASSHTRKLATLFRDEMHKRDIHTLASTQGSSIAVVTDVPAVESLQHALKGKRVQCSLVHATLNSEKSASGLRFCFHHFHSDDDVRDLAEFLGNAVIEAYARTEPSRVQVPERNLISST